MSTLTERRHRQTRRAIADAALGLFHAHGYGNVTMDQVAEAAGVSRRTAYRHFPNKYDLVFDHPHRWLETFTATVETRAPEESTRSIIRRGVMAVATEIDATAADVLVAMQVFTSEETLRGRNARAQHDWRLAYTELIGRDLTDASDTLQVATIAGALVAMTDVLCETWASSYPDHSMVELTTRSLDIVDSLWPPATR